MSSSKSWLRSAPALVALAVVATACSFSFSFGSNDLDIDKAEREIESGIEEQTGVLVESVDCPDEVEIKEGDTFTCDVTAEDGETAKVEVVQEDDEGNVSWELIGG